MPLSDAVAGLGVGAEANGQDEDVYEADGQTVEFDAVEADPAPVGSVLAALRHAVAAGPAEAPHIDIEMPTFRGVLFARFGPVPMTRIYRPKRNGDVTNPFIEPEIAADVLATGLIEFLKFEDGELSPLASDYGPVRFDDTLTELLRLAPTAHTARAVVYALWAHTGRADAIITKVFVEFYTWLTGEDAPNAAVIEDAVGESLGHS